MNIIEKIDKYLNESKGEYGKGLTAIDIDDTLFRTFAKVGVAKDGKVVRELDNQEFNTYELKPGETFDYGEFRSADLFYRTSIPIPKTVNRIKRMMKNIHVRGSKVIFLTAREDFDNKKTFLSTFKKHGIPIDNIYVERAGNERTGTIASAKKKILIKYINTGEYRRIRLIDDNLTNLRQFLTIKDQIPQKTINKIKQKHNIPLGEMPIEFFALQVGPDGSLTPIQ